MSELEGTSGPKYDKDKVYSSAFRHLRPPFPVLVQESKELGVSPVGVVKALKGSFKLKSKLNAEYTCPTKFRFLGKNSEMEEWQVPQEPSSSVEGGKNIIETQLNRGERTGNVIEEVNLNNKKVTIKGVIINEEDFDVYPEEDVRMLSEICDAPGSIEVQNWHLNQFGISKIVIERYDFYEIVGYPNAQAFELTCKSDEDFELELVDEPERL
jgi:hypothetical protein